VADGRDADSGRDYLLGLYLGDGHIARFPKGVFVGPKS
jgi:hypothetical protein